MAAAIVPIAAALLPEIPNLISLIANLVHGFAPAVEAKYGPGTGPVKFADVFGSVITNLQSAATAGLIPKALPSDETVKLVIESVISSMNATGLLSGAPVTVPAGSQPITLKAGQSITVTVAL